MGRINGMDEWDGWMGSMVENVRMSDGWSRIDMDGLCNTYF